MSTETRRSAEIIPFPICRTESARFIAAEYARRPEKGRYDKADYAAKVIANNIERLQRFGVSQERIDSEVTELRALFYRLGDDADEKARA